MGQAEYRTISLDYDARRKPKTDRSCVCCQRDLKPGTNVRRVHIVDECYVLHPQDEEKYQAAGALKDSGMHLIGFDCAKRLGLEWTTVEMPCSQESGGSERRWLI